MRGDCKMISNPIEQDKVFLECVRSLTRIAANAIEEAEGYAEDIEDEKIREEAQRLIDSI